VAEREGYRVPDSSIVVDELSGASLERPGLQQLRELVRSRSVAAVIVYDLDRLCRRLGHQSLLLDEMDRAGVALHVVASPIEDTPEGMLLTRVRGAMAEYKGAKIKERTKRGMLGRARAGHVWSGVVPLGYRYVSKPHGGAYVIDEAEAAVVRRTYRLCLEGLTMRAIALRLTQERVPTVMDRGLCGRGPRKRVGVDVWHRSSVHAIMKRRTDICTDQGGLIVIVRAAAGDGGGPALQVPPPFPIMKTAPGHRATLQARAARPG
jgi:DNA invertase Pin-like site-specific DNA recombinase